MILNPTSVNMHKTFLSLHKLAQAKKMVKYHKCQSNLFFGQKLIFELFVKSKKNEEKLQNFDL